MTTNHLPAALASARTADLQGLAMRAGRTQPESHRFTTPTVRETARPLASAQLDPTTW